MTKKRKTICVLLCILLILTLAFIWGNSFASKERSSAFSEWAEAVLEPLLRALLGDAFYAKVGIRKLAHFCEFAALGAEGMTLLAILDRRNPQWYFNLFAFGLTTAVTDESIQIFTGRGPAVKDVLIDTGGFLTGAACALLLCAMLLALQAQRKKKCDGGNRP